MNHTIEHNLNRLIIISFIIAITYSSIIQLLIADGYYWLNVFND